MDSRKLRILTFCTLSEYNTTFALIPAPKAG
jgi:hypothetical protein